MTQGKFDERAKEAMKKRLGYDDEELRLMEENPKMMDLIRAGPAFTSKKMVATCIKAEHCSYNQVGDRYVFHAYGSMIKDETCENPCLLAMSNFLPFCYMVYDRIASGLDPDGMHLDHVCCPDTGCRHGGFGRAIFKITIEEA